MSHTLTPIKPPDQKVEININGKSHVCKKQFNYYGVADYVCKTGKLSKQDRERRRCSQWQSMPAYGGPNFICN